jgi:polar amino acid transport system permease protein
MSDIDIIRLLIMSARWTLLLTIAIGVSGALIGILVLFLRVSAIGFFRRTAAFYIWIFQSTPLLMQLFLTFFGLALLEVEVSAWLVAWLASSLWAAAFLAEIWRGCVNSIARGQWEASSGLGMSYLQQMTYVILPQAFRISIPPTVGFVVQIVKATSLTSIIGFAELTKVGSIVSNVTFMPFKVYAIVGLIYFAICWPLSTYSRYLERRLDADHIAA